MGKRKNIVIASVVLLVGSLIFWQQLESTDYITLEQHEEEMRDLQVQFEEREKQILKGEIVLNRKEEDDRLTKLYKSYEGTYGFDHWLEYGKHYDHHLRNMKTGPEFVMLELGVQSGGSTRIWNSYFGESSKYVGVDINPECEQFESPNENIVIEIGSQLDSDFLKKICNDYGPFDFVIDDGGHITNMMMVSFYALWGCMKDGGIYVIEDTHSIILRSRDFDGMLYDGKDIFENMGDLARGQMEYYGDKDKNKAVVKTDAARSKMRPYSDHLESMTIYDSLIFLKYQENKQTNTRFKKGNFIPYGVGTAAAFGDPSKKSKAS